MDRLLVRVAVSVATLLVAALVVFVAVLCLGGAAYLALREVMRPTLAALATGFGALLLALLMGLIGRAATSCRRASRGASAGTEEARLAGLLGKELAALIRGHARVSVLASLAAGFAVGVSPSLRKFLRDLLKD